MDRSKRYEEEVIHILSPRPPTGPRASHTQHSGPEGDHSESSESVNHSVWENSQQGLERDWIGIDNKIVQIWHRLKVLLKLSYTFVIYFGRCQHKQLMYIMTAISLLKGITFNR